MEDVCFICVWGLDWFVFDILNFVIFLLKDVWRILKDDIGEEVKDMVDYLFCDFYFIV